jgi:formylglycine-generating enzyme required for sulfatase activity
VAEQFEVPERMLKQAAAEVEQSIRETTNETAKAMAGEKKLVKELAAWSRRKPNAFGLYDLHGNVGGWCHDYFAHYYYEMSPSDDPQGVDSGTFRSFRGCNWKSTLGFSRMCDRSRQPPNCFENTIGFRIVRELAANGPG